MVLSLIQERDRLIAKLQDLDKRLNEAFNPNPEFYGKLETLVKDLAAGNDGVDHDPAQDA
jgi:hypothetical protein